MKTILAIGAHPDDIEIDCAGIIAREIGAGNRVVFYILTNGDKGGDSTVREQEALASAKILGVNDIIFEGLADCSLRYDQSLVQRMITTIRQTQPDMIYTHCQRDISPDHKAIGEATILASRDVSEVFAYKGSPQWNNFSPTTFVDVGEQLDLKCEALSKFASQNAQDQFGLDYVVANAVHYGRMSNCGIQYAEAFETVRLAR